MPNSVMSVIGIWLVCLPTAKYMQAFEQELLVSKNNLIIGFHESPTSKLSQT